MGLSADRFVVAMFALVVSFIDEGIWAVQGRCELVLVEEGNVRLGTRTLVVLVVNKLDSLKFGCHDVWRFGFPSRETILECLGGPSYHLKKGKRM